MAKFVYRMQNILDLKIKMEEQRKAEYGLANARLRKEEDKLREPYRDQTVHRFYTQW